MNESEFHQLADTVLSDLSEKIEASDDGGVLDVECQSGVVTIEAPAGKQFVISKHVPTRQIWLSSPVSGGLHFIRNDSGQWALPDGRTLNGVLARDIQSVSGVGVKL